MQNTNRQDIYTRITGQIIASLEKGVRPWVKPWTAEHAAGRITRPLRHNGQPYSGQHSDALGVGDRRRVRRADLDDLSPGAGAGRAGAQGREGVARCLRQFNHAHG